MFLPLKIATRFLKSSKGQTIMITLGIAIGVSVQIFIGLLIQGLQSSLIDKTIGNSSQITITSSAIDKKITDYQLIIDEITLNEKRIKHISPALDGPAFISNESVNEAVLVRGFALDKADSIYKLEASLIEGRMPTGPNEIIIGKGLYASSDTTLDGDLNLLVPDKGIKTLVVVGVFDLKVAAINRSWIITNLSSAQSLFEVEDTITSIEIQIDDVFMSDIIAVSINELLANDTLNIIDWQSQNEELLSGLSGQSVSSIMIQVFVIIAVVLGIASVLAISVLQKSKQLGILKAMGIRDGAASLIFLIQGLMLGLLGAISGIILGLLLSVAFTKFALNPDGSPLIPLVINYSFILLSGIIAITASMLASLIPAIRSSRLDPIEVIKNG